MRLFHAIFPSDHGSRRLEENKTWGNMMALRSEFLKSQKMYCTSGFFTALNAKRIVLSIGTSE